MAWPPEELSEHAGPIAVWSSIIGVAIAAAFRQFFGVKKGFRDDKAADAQNSSWSGTVTAQNESWIDVVMGLREQLAQFRIDFDNLQASYRQEVAARREAEDTAAECERGRQALEARVTALERMVKELGGIP